MSTMINSNYSQFYKGSETIKAYGSGSGAKDTIVRYEFNTIDAHGNKIMDKMSKEETMKTMRDITSQYGDNVIVEFSGDGLAALEVHKGMFPEEHKEIPEGMITQLEGPEPLTEEQLRSMMNPRHGDDVEAQMRVTDPDAYNEYQKIKADAYAGGTKEDLAGIARYMLKWITNKAINAPGWEEGANKKIEKETTAESKLSTNAQKYLDKLRKQYGDFDFVIAGKGDDRKAFAKQGTKEFSVIFDIEELERMANDEKYADEKLRRMQTAVDMSIRICEEYGYGRNGGANGTLNSLSVSFDKDGSTSIFAELEKTSEKQRERIEATKEKRAEEKKAAEKKAEEKRAEEKKAESEEEQPKRISIAASSEEDLIKQLSSIDWEKAFFT